MELIDIGANLTHHSFDRDRAEVIAGAQDAGVVAMVVTGSSVEGSQDAAALASDHSGYLFATAGIHPHHAKDYRLDQRKELLKLLALPEVVAVGECGLDYFRNFSPPGTQREVFRHQIEIAVETNLPVFLHQREAHDDFVRILSESLDRIPRAVAHCFTGDQTELREYLDLGLYIGITGWICDERRGQHLRELIPMIPADRLLVETDAPYLLPRDLDPKPSDRRNVPAYLPHIVGVIASAAERDPVEIAQETTANARRFFGLG